MRGFVTYLQRLGREQADLGFDATQAPTIPGISGRRTFGAGVLDVDPTSVDITRRRTAITQRRRPAIPQGVAPGGTIADFRTTSPGNVLVGDIDTTTAAYRELARIVNTSNNEIRRFLEEVPNLIGADGLTNQERIARSFDQTIGDLELDTTALAENRMEVTTLITEWQQLQQTIDRFVSETPLAQAFSASNRQLINNTGRDLAELRNELVGVISEFTDPGLIPPNAITAVNQISNAIQALTANMGLAQDAARDLREELIDERVRLTDTEFSQQFPELTQFPTEQNIFNHPYFRGLRQQQREAERQLRQQQIDRESQIAEYFAGATESLYTEFAAPSILDAIGIGSAQSRARERSLDRLSEDVERQRNEIRENERLNEREQAEELLEINRDYEREKREIERQYEEERSDAWASWVRQQLTDFPKLIFQQLNLQLAARATNYILSSLGLGGNIPISQGGLLSGGGSTGGGLIPGLFNNNPLGSGAAATGSGSGTAAAGASGAGGAGLAASAATVGTIASAALAAHNIGTGIQEGLFDDLGRDFANLPIINSVTTFFDNLAFHDPINDALANTAGRQSSRNMAARLGRESATDIVSNFRDGFNSETNQARSSSPQQPGNTYMVSGDTTINIPFEIDDRIVKQISFTMDELAADGRL